MPIALASSSGVCELPKSPEGPEILDLRPVPRVVPSVCGDNQGASPVTDCCCQAGLPIRSQLGMGELIFERGPALLKVLVLLPAR